MLYSENCINVNVYLYDNEKSFVDFVNVHCEGKFNDKNAIICIRNYIIHRLVTQMNMTNEKLDGYVELKIHIYSDNVNYRGAINDTMLNYFNHYYGLNVSKLDDTKTISSKIEKNVFKMSMRYRKFLDNIDW
jgi:hypothetical protein